MAFEHGVDKALIPTVKILGVNIAAINMEWLVNFTLKDIKKLSGDYICVANVHTTVTAYEDEKYKAIQNGGLMAIPDGGPLSSLGRRRGAEGITRTTGPSYMSEILEQEGYRHYFYGSTPETLEKLYKSLTRDYPKSIIVGMYSPPFRQLTEEEDSLISFGWVWEHQSKKNGWQLIKVRLGA